MLTLFAFLGWGSGVRLRGIVWLDSFFCVLFFVYRLLQRREKCCFCQVSPTFYHCCLFFMYLFHVYMSKNRYSEPTVPFRSHLHPHLAILLAPLTGRHLYLLCILINCCICILIVYFNIFYLIFFILIFYFNICILICILINC